ncbi:MULTISPECIES: protein-disulfide reductase DsbD family protein [Flavobacteriaceae]|uniref:protein-disulfide reductase DsbD family protein n=1 Tax=Flavobacteriaceae TaxID=49546 RepID=UPI001491E23F|nr:MULTISPECIES: thioredoxin family protein [Allomuricauda]MDC6367787.1 cytochrome c biogenesis protein CcdA [Muricauda sp. AC10]
MKIQRHSLIPFILLLGLWNSGFAQILDPVKWNTAVEKLSEDQYELKITAKIDRGWHLYSQDVPKDGPIATSFVFDDDAAYKLVEHVKEEKGKTINDPIFKMRIKFFEKKAVFTQIITATAALDKVTATVEYMVCDDTRCLPPTAKELTFALTKKSVVTTEAQDQVISDIDNASTNIQLYGFSTEELTAYNAKASKNVLSGPVQNEENSGSFLGIFGLGFLGGLLALLTPCVFPMIPLTVSFFTKQGGTDSKGGFFKALLYGFFILLVYLILSVPFHLLDSVNPDILNEISTNVWLNLIFFIIFLFFAFSFFGYYEITLPSSWTSKTTSNENIGGFLGIFFMALTLALVSFSCTGPILGSLLAGSLSSSGGAWQLTAGMGGFGLALGLPFALFAMFPNMMNALPKSGGWLNTTKVILGFLELALAFKFLSNADLVQHWGILKIEPFLIIWIIVFIGLALYLLGKIRFPHDSPLKKLAPLRILGGLVVAAFVVYLVSGFRINPDTKMYRPLKLLSGLAPPVGYSFLHPNKCPNNLSCYKDLKSGLAQAKKEDKPILLDFTGYACVNCRKMEEHVWSEKEIDKLIRNEYVLISLYVDDKKELPKDEQVQVKLANGGTRTLKNYGHKWAHFQTQFFNTNSQPYYVLLDSESLQVLNTPVGYTPESDTYGNWLKEAINDK